MFKLRRLVLLCCALCASLPASGDEIRVAVAANFLDALSALAPGFEQNTGHKVRISSGSTGKLYAQIRNGAPFDVLLAADDQRPALLEQEGAIVPGSRFTYALGALVLWSPDEHLIDSEASVLQRDAFRFLAIANPATAPYGRATREVLTALGLWQGLVRKMVRGENIGQTYQYVYSRNAELGFVARSQVYRNGRYAEGSWWPVPASLHTPIVQQAVLLNDTAAGRALLDYLRSPEGLALIRRHGYDIPSGG